MHIDHLFHSSEEFEGLQRRAAREEATPEFTMPAECSLKDGYKETNDSMTEITHAPKTPAKEPFKGRLIAKPILPCHS